MHDEQVAGAQLNHKVLGATRHAPNGLPFEPRRKIRRKCVAEIRPSGEDALNPRAAHRALQSSSLVLDFRQFRHSL